MTRPNRTPALSATTLQEPAARAPILARPGDTAETVAGGMKNRTSTRDANGAQQVMARQSALLDGAGHALRMGGWEVRLPGAEATWSDQVCDLHRIARGSRPSIAQVLSLYAPASRAQVGAAMEACMRDGAPYDLEAELVIGDEHVWLRITGQAELDSTGRICRVYGACQDISDKKAAEQALAHSERRFRELADAMPHLVWTADADGRLNFVNRAVVDYTGVAREQVYDEGWHNLLHPDDLAPTLANWTEALARRTVFTMDYRILHAVEQRYRWCHVTAMPGLDEHGTIVWYGNTTDIDDSRRTAVELAQAARRHLATLESISDAFFTLDRECRFTYLNAEAERLFGKPHDALLGVAMADAFAPSDYSDLFAPALSALGGGSTITFEAWSAPLARWLEVRAYPSEDGATVHLRDVSSRHEFQERLRLMRRAMEACANPIAILRAEPPFSVTYLNSAFTRITGHTTEDAGRLGLGVMWGARDSHAGLQELLAAAHDQRQHSGTIKVARHGGADVWLDTSLSPVPGADGRITHFILVMYDVTAARQYEAELEYHSNYDTLTGLANRNLLGDRADQAFRRAEAGGKVWLAYLNLDRFKAINDALGHAAGDDVLRATARRLQDAVHPADTVARIASDEFVLLLERRPDRSAAVAQARAIAQAIGAPLRIGERDVFVTCSVGIAAWPDDSTSFDALLSQASMARYRASQAGAAYGFYTAAMNDDAMERLQLEAELRQALDRRELEVFYQPQVDAANGRIVGAEALLRWHHPRLGLISPARFIAIAEESALIAPIGAWVMESACRQACEWQAHGLNPVRIAVNLSARQFYAPGLAENVRRTLDESGLEAEWLELELTERIAIENLAQAVDIMRGLKAVGVKLAIDDFGTGYSSLSHLKNFPVDVLKVDQSFVRNIATEPDEATIARTIVALGHNLGLQVVAEGVESEDQLAFLRRHRCDQIQGYYFSPPVPAGEFEALLSQGRFRMDGQDAEQEARQTLLVVDDEPHIISALERLMRGSGYRILRAQSAYDGFALLARHEVQVILSDHLMPGMTGTEFLSRVKQMYPNTIRMMLSGYTRVDSILEATNSGAVFRFHTKPWDADVLRKSIDDAFRYYWSQRA